MELVLRGQKKISSGRILERSWDLELGNSKALWNEIQADSVELQTALYCKAMRKIYCKPGYDKGGGYWKMIQKFEDNVLGHIEDGWELKWSIS